MNTMLIITIIIIMSKIQFLLQVHKKDLFLLLTAAEVAFISNPSHPNHCSLLRTSRCGILLNQRITAF